MLYVKADGNLGAKVADLGTAVQLSGPRGVVTDPAGTTGYAGVCFFIVCSVLLLVLFIFGAVLMHSVDAAQYFSAPYSPLSLPLIFSLLPRTTAPEIFSPEGYGLPSDVYSFGVLMWEACCTTAPASSNNPLAGLDPTLAVEKVRVLLY